MAQIVETVAGDKRLLLYNEEICRAMTVGTLWNHIRVGIRVAFNFNQTIGGNLFAIGVCEGTSDGFKSNSTTDFIGTIFGNNIAGATFTYNAGAPAYVSTTGWYAAKRTGSTTTLANTSTGTVYCSSAPAASRSVIMVDIIKRSPNYFIHPWFPVSAAAAQLNMDLGTLMLSMENDINTGGMNFFSNITDISLAYAGSGLFDSINVSWNNAAYPVEISDICALSFY